MNEDHFDNVRWLIGAIARFEDAVVCVADEDLQTYAEARLRSARVDMARVRFV